jgi:hypothetical protein
MHAVLMGIAAAVLLMARTAFAAFLAPEIGEPSVVAAAEA